MLVSVTYYFWVSFSLGLNEIVAERNNLTKSESNEIYKRSHNVLSLYLVSLEHVISYLNEHKAEMDFGNGFGLFLVTANLKPFTENNSLPASLRGTLKRILKVNEEIQIFLKNALNDEGPFKLKVMKVFIKYISSWMLLKKLGTNLQKTSKFHIDRDHQNDPDWNTYFSLVNDLEKWEPSPEEFDDCLTSLAENDEDPSPQECIFPEICNKMLNSGTNFGYALTHRLLFLLIAHFSEGCTIAGSEKKRHNFCEMIYSEAVYIAFNEYKHMDMITEQIALCSLDGHAEFLNSSWISNLILHQTPEGCFSQGHARSFYRIKIIESGEVKWTRDNNNGNCNIHFTALAAASVAAAVRFILENM